MKTIKDFLSTELKVDESVFFYGGKEHPTTLMGENCPDTWYDNDNDGDFSPGDSICFQECANQQ